MTSEKVILKNHEEQALQILKDEIEESVNNLIMRFRISIELLHLYSLNSSVKLKHHIVILKKKISVFIHNTTNNLSKYK